RLLGDRGLEQERAVARSVTAIPHDEVDARLGDRLADVVGELVLDAKLAAQTRDGAACGRHSQGDCRQLQIQSLLQHTRLEPARPAAKPRIPRSGRLFPE